MNMHLKNIKRSLQQILLFGKIIIHNRWWDYYFLLKLMHVQLLYMESKWLDEGMHMHPMPAYNSIKLCRILIARIIEDDYNDDAPWRMYEYQSELFEGETFTLTKDVKVSDARKQRDLDLLFSTMKKHILTWWD